MTDLKQLVDAFGLVKAEAAEVAKKEKKLREQLIAFGITEAEGDLFRVTISQSERETLDMAAVREKLSPQFIAAHTKVTSVTTVKAVARSQTGAVLKFAA